MADRYWVGGTNTWNATATGKWSTTSGGASGAAVPTAADDVYFDGNSGAVTITIGASRVCRSLNCTGFTGSIGGANTPVLSIGDASGGALTLGSGMSVMATTVSLNFVSTSNNGGTGWSITSNGVAWYGLVTFDGVGGKWILQDAFSVNAFNLAITNGTFDSNNKNITTTGIISSNSNTRTITLGTSTLTLTQYFPGNAVWDTSTTTGLTLSASSCTINIEPLLGSSLDRYFYGGGQSFGTLTYTHPISTGKLIFNGSNTFNTLNFGSGKQIIFQNGTTTTVTNWNVAGSILGYQRLTSYSGHTIYSTDSAPLSVTGDITCLMRIAMDSWTPFPAHAMLAKRISSTENRTFVWNINASGIMTFVTSSDGTSATNTVATASVSPGFSAGSTNWILVSRRSSDGRVQFFTASGAITNPVASDFSQLGTDVSNTAGGLYDSTAPLEIGSYDDGATQNASMNVYRVKIYNGLFSASAFGGSLVYDADFTTKQFLSDSFVESSGNNGAVNMTGSVVAGDGRVEITSTTPGSQYTISKSSGTASSNFMKITDSNVTGGAVWYAGNYSANNGNNTGWIFTTQDRGSFMQMM